PAAAIGTEAVWPGGSYYPRLNPFRRRRVVTIHVADEAMYLPPDGDPREQTELVMARISSLIAEVVDGSPS
ncbi:MAG TPA: hypothetical protein VGM93_15580, partial [Acidimicrobiales bacterium]